MFSTCVHGVITEAVSLSVDESNSMYVIRIDLRDRNNNLVEYNMFFDSQEAMQTFMATVVKSFTVKQ